MDSFGLIIWLIIGAAAGWIAEKIMNFDTGLLMNVVLGVAGAFVGNFLLTLIDFQLGGFLGQLITAVLGASLLIYIYKAMKGRTA